MDADGTPQARAAPNQYEMCPPSASMTAWQRDFIDRTNSCDSFSQKLFPYGFNSLAQLIIAHFFRIMFGNVVLHLISHSLDRV